MAFVLVRRKWGCTPQKAPESPGKLDIPTEC
jgi:hypothetical protein